MLPDLWDHPRCKAVVDYFLRRNCLYKSKKDKDGRYILDWNPMQAPLKPGKRGAPNKWITFYALKAQKHRNRG